MAINSDANDPCSHLANYVYPKEMPASTSNALFEKMYNETIDMLESNDVSTLNANNVSRGFSIVMDNIADFYFKPMNGSAVMENTNKSNHILNSSTELNESITSDVSTSDHLPNINTVNIPIPKLIPVINGLAQQQFSSTNQPPGLSTSLVTLYLISEKVKILGANTYEVFCQ